MKKNNILYTKNLFWKVVHLDGFKYEPSWHFAKCAKHYGIYMRTKNEIIIKPITSKNSDPSMEIKKCDDTYFGKIAEYGIICNVKNNILKLTFKKKSKFSEESINESFQKFENTFNRELSTGDLKKHPPHNKLIELNEEDSLD